MRVAEAGPVQSPYPRRCRRGSPTARVPAGRDVTARTAQTQWGKVSEGRSETGAPDDGVHFVSAAVGPLHSGGGEPGEHPFRVKESGVAGRADRGYGDDVAERGDAAGVSVAAIEGAAAGGGDVEQDAALRPGGLSSVIRPQHPGHDAVTPALVAISGRPQTRLDHRHR